RGRPHDHVTPFVGADVGGGPDRARLAVEVGGDVGRYGGGVTGGRIGVEVIVAAGRVGEERGRRAGERVLVLAGRRPPGRQGEHAVAPVEREASRHGIGVAHEAGQAVRGDRDGAAEGVQREQDVVDHAVAGAAVLDVDGPAAVGGLHDGVVGDEVVAGGRAAVD